MVGPRVDPETFKRLSTADKVETLLEMSLDSAYSVLARNHEDPELMLRDRMRLLEAKVRVTDVVLRVSIKLQVESARLRQQREQIFGELAADYRRLTSNGGGPKKNSGN